MTKYTKDEQSLIQAGIPSGTIDDLNLHGVTVVISPYRIKFAKGGNVITKVAAISSSFVKNPSHIEDVLTSIISAIGSVLAQMQDIDNSVLHKGTDNTAIDNVKSVPDFVPISTGTTSSVEHPQSLNTLAAQQWGLATLNTMKKGTPVSLELAKDMYQPVKSTSAGSVYHAVALSNTIAVAARLKGNSLAIRIEKRAGVVWETVKKKLIQSKVFHQPYANINSSGYASAHFSCGDNETADMALAAILASLDSVGLKVNTPLPKSEIFGSYGK